MKEIEITLWEISKQEAQKLKELTPVLEYNTLTNDYSIEHSTKRAIFNNKYCSEYLKFFTFEKPEFEEPLQNNV